jgi:hypothetical protein
MTRRTRDGKESGDYVEDVWNGKESGDYVEDAERKGGPGMTRRTRNGKEVRG